MLNDSWDSFDRSPLGLKWKWQRYHRLTRPRRNHMYTQIPDPPDERLSQLCFHVYDFVASLDSFLTHGMDSHLSRVSFLLLLLPSSRTVVPIPRTPLSASMSHRRLEQDVSGPQLDNEAYNMDDGRFHGYDNSECYMMDMYILLMQSTLHILTCLYCVGLLPPLSVLPMCYSVFLRTDSFSILIASVVAMN